MAVMIFSYGLSFHLFLNNFPIYCSTKVGMLFWLVEKREALAFISSQITINHLLSETPQIKQKVSVWICTSYSHHQEIKSTYQPVLNHKPSPTSFSYQVYRDRTPSLDQSSKSRATTVRTKLFTKTLPLLAIFPKIINKYYTCQMMSLVF